MSVISTNKLLKEIYRRKKKHYPKNIFELQRVPVILLQRILENTVYSAINTFLKMAFS
ncbi:hypothetical protein KHA80_18190 [Anaerobacillus sp. HL2]|nr:hypothetical protein KHA80_18190 [Anaerobacillus sp. HL2]